jgi:Xaa-Pro dipeptidase
MRTSPMTISRVHSLERPIEIEEGMVFALETYCAASDDESAGRIEDEFPADELLVCGATYVRGADLLERESSTI